MPQRSAPRIWLARDLRELTGSAHRLEHAAKRGEIVRVGSGVYADSRDWAELAPDDRLAWLCRMQHRRFAKEPVFSHESAAALHGIPVIGGWPAVPTVTVEPGSTSSSRALRRVRRALPAHHVVELEHGIRATSRLRTAIDLAATGSPLTGVCAFSALRWDGIPVGSIECAIDECGRMPGAARARLALRRSTAGSESPLETLVMVRCRELGFEMPIQQWSVEGRDGRRYRCDFAWCGGDVLGEADGRVKYEDGPERTGRERLWAEKRREDDIRSGIRALLRITWDDAWSGDALATMLDRAGVPRTGRRRSPLSR